MSTHAILDSSPVALPPIRPRPLKRSASTASLPTPPRTLDKKKSRSRSRHSAQDTDSESNYSQSDSDGEQQEDKVVSGRKKRRTSMALRGNDEEEDENEFWTGRRGKARDTDDDASPALLQYRVKALVSPPPSLRQTTSAPEPPVTPESAGSSSSRTTRLRAARRQALRDSPENPFLDDSPPSAAGSPVPRTPTKHEEKPLVTYVFRGMKAQFANPMYNLPPSAHEHSLLPVEHPDFEANEACPPKLLFPLAHRRQVRRRSPDASLPPMNRTNEEIERTDSLRAGAVVRGREGPVKRAQGPVRHARR